MTNSHIPETLKQNLEHTFNCPVEIKEASFCERCQKKLKEAETKADATATENGSSTA